MAVGDAEKAELKKAIYDKISPRRRKYIDKMGYDNWDPFQEPQDPLDLREDSTERTGMQLVREFLAEAGEREGDRVSDEFSKGAWELCMGMLSQSERHRGMYEFCIWYQKQLENRGIPGRLRPNK